MADSLDKFNELITYWETTIPKMKMLQSEIKALLTEMEEVKVYHKPSSISYINNLYETYSSRISGFEQGYETLRDPSLDTNEKNIQMESLQSEYMNSSFHHQQVKKRIYLWKSMNLYLYKI